MSERMEEVHYFTVLIFYNVKYSDDNSSQARMETASFSLFQFINDHNLGIGGSNNDRRE